MIALFSAFAMLVAPPDELHPPILISAGNQPINVDLGHAAPFVGDIDGDGKQDLLVGQYGGGRLRIYRNEGTNTAPRFDRFRWLEANAGIASVHTN